MLVVPERWFISQYECPGLLQKELIPLLQDPSFQLLQYLFFILHRFRNCLNVCYLTSLNLKTLRKWNRIDLEFFKVKFVKEGMSPNLINSEWPTAYSLCHIYLK